MLKDTLEELREEAREIGAEWVDVVQVKNELVEVEREVRAPRREARQEAWWSYVGRGSGSAPFWRHGFVARFGRRLAEGDYTLIPCYDEIADVVRQEVGEYSGWETQEIWDFLLSDYRPWPPREKFYWEALERVARGQRSEVREERDEVPF